MLTAARPDAAVGSRLAKPSTDSLKAESRLSKFHEQTDKLARQAISYILQGMSKIRLHLLHAGILPELPELQ